ncbi:CDP-glycerol glycerophosphotransferase family protein [Proteus terrae]|uniref:CDP-glycerol glycerophosphotransferase family protein n=1 Tax=Proteus terrae TaxID=1574161 RepID=UPI00288A42E5|nr:CDP-glycerol glycerophosphotransferase family protein [Proteus terrae]
MNILCRLIISLIDFFIPKNKRKISIPCIDDNEWQGNCSFFSQYLIKNKELLGIQINILCNKKSFLFRNKTTQCHTKHLYSFKGIWTLLTSGIVIYHHGPLAGRIPLISPYRINFHINHGIHFKKVELALDPTSQEYKNISFIKTKWFCKYHSVSSNIDALSCCSYYHTYLSNIFITGIPRNDLFFINNDDLLPQDVISDINKLKKLAGNRKIILYAPTWRNKGGAYIFDQDEKYILEDFLIKNNYIFIYAGHPYLKNRVIPQSEYIIDYNNNFSDIQSVLSIADILITDYSSIWIDFLLKDKPIIGFQFDHDTYEDDRGFLFDYNDVFPGEIVYDFQSLISVLKFNMSKSFIKTEKFAFSKKIFHKFTDGKNCERIANSLLSIKND